jgi:integrase/recombinase XerD
VSAHRASPHPPLPLDAEEFLSWLTVERGRSANTIAAYRRDLNAYCAYLAGHHRTLDAVTEADIERYVQSQQREGKAATSVARSLVAVRSLHRFLAEEGRMARNPAAAVESPKVPQGLPKPLSEAEVESLLASVVGHGPLERRDRAILEVLYGTGIRISELVGLSMGDVDLADRVMRVFGKGSHERVVPIGRFAADALTDWLATSGRGALVPERWARRGDAEAVFLNARGGRLSRQGAWGIVRAYADRVGLGDRLSPHVLRHSCATHMLDHGADIRVVQELLGHASVATTQVYTLVSAERLRSVYENAHPRAKRSR